MRLHQRWRSWPNSMRCQSECHRWSYKSKYIQCNKKINILYRLSFRCWSLTSQPVQSPWHHHWYHVELACHWWSEPDPYCRQRCQFRWPKCHRCNRQTHSLYQCLANWTDNVPQSRSVARSYHNPTNTAAPAALPCHHCTAPATNFACLRLEHMT